MFQRILVAVDGSEDSSRALERAIELAQGIQAPVVGVVHVTPGQETWLPGYGYAGTSADVWERIHRELEESSQKLLGEATTRIREAIPEATVVPHRLTGSIAGAIIQLVRQHQYDLLVVGSRGMGRAAGLLLGSVSQALVANLPASVLIVKPKDKK